MKPSSSKVYPSQIITNFQSFRKNRIFFLHGNDSFLKDQIIDTVRKNFTTDRKDEFDTMTFYGDSSRAVDIVENLEMQPFLSPFKFILVKNFDSFKKSDKDIISQYCKAPLKTSVLVIIADKVDNRTSLMKTISQNGVICECKKPYNSASLLRWLDSELKMRKVSMNRQAKNFFVNNLELSYQAAANELEKLFLFTHGRQVYTLEDVEQTLGAYRENNIYDLQRAIGSRNITQSHRILQNMLASEESNNIGVMLVSMLTRYFLVLWKINIYRQNNYSDREIVQNQLSEVFYSFREEYISASHSYSIPELRKVFSCLLKADTDLKSINIHDTTLFLLIHKVCTL